MTAWGALFRTYTGSDTADTIDTTHTATAAAGDCVDSVDCVTGAEGESLPSPLASQEVAAKAAKSDEQRRHAARVAWWRRGGYSDEEAALLAWGATATEWYRHHGILTPDHICAGCGEALSGTAVLLLPHGERAHADIGYRCVIAYGRRWRSAAARALEAAGIATPAGALDLDEEPSAAGGDLPPRAA